MAHPPYPPIQAREMMNPLPGFTRQNWQALGEDRRAELILASRAEAMKEKETPPEGKPTARGAMPQAEQAGTTPSGKKVVQQVSALRGAFDKADN